MKYALVAILSLFLSACATTITSEPSTGGFVLTNSTVVKDLQSASYNLDQAVAIGVLLPTDPGPKCIHDIMIKAGIEIPAGATPPKSFQPKRDGVASSGAIAYILAQQLKNAKPLAVSPDCEALVGRIVIDGAKALNKTVPSLLGVLK